MPGAGTSSQSPTTSTESRPLDGEGGDPADVKQGRFKVRSRVRLPAAPAPPVPAPPPVQAPSANAAPAVPAEGVALVAVAVPPRILGRHAALCDRLDHVLAEIEMKL